MTLYELDERIENYEMEFDPDTGEWINENELNDLEMERDKKLESIGLYIKELAAEAEAIKAEIAKLTERMRTVVNKQKRLLDYLRKSLNGEKFKTARLLVSYRKTRSAQILDENIIPDEYKRFKTTSEPNKDAIKKAIDSGKEVPGAIVVENINMTVK